MKKKVLIIGGSGFIGLNLIKLLLKKNNFKIHATFNKNPISIKANNFKKIKIDLREEKPIEKLFKKEKYNYVIMSAGEIFNVKSNKKNLKEKMLSNIFIHTNCLKNVVKYKVEKYIWISSSTGYPKVKKRKIFKEEDFFKEVPSSNHQIAGWHSRYFESVCENLSKISKTKFITLRPSEVFGEYDNFKSNFSRIIPLSLNNIINKKKVILDKTFYIKKNYIYVGTLAYFIFKFIEMKNLKNNYNVFNLSDDKSYSLIDIDKILKKNFNIGFNIKNKINLKSKDIFFKSYSNKKILAFFKIKKVDSFKIGIKKTFLWRYNNISNRKSLGYINNN